MSTDDSPELRPIVSGTTWWRTAAMTIASASLIIVAFPPVAIRSLAWIALVPHLLVLRRVSLRAAAALGALWGMVGAYGVTHWLPSAVSGYYQQSYWLGLGLFSVAAFVMGAAEYALFSVFYRWCAGRGVRALPLVGAAAWTVAELARTRLFGGNPWGLLGYTQTGLNLSDGAFGLYDGIAPLALIQIADLTGVYGIGFVLVAVNCAWVELWPALRASVASLIPLGSSSYAPSRVGVGRLPSSWLSNVALPLLIAASVFAYGAARIAVLDKDTRVDVDVGIAQANLDLGSQWREDLYGLNLDVYLGLTHQLAGAAPRPAVVFWPENAMTFFVDSEPLYRAVIAHETAPADFELVAGAPRYENAADPVYFNSAFVLAPDGSVTAIYDKERLLPFAEYFPFGAADFLRRQFARVREFTPGTRIDPLATRAGRAGITICNEAMFPHVVRKRVLAGAEYLVNLSNDTWIPDPDFAEHQLALVSVRAVEQRRWLVRASTSGPSAIVDPLGRISARTRTASAEVLTGAIAPSSSLTPYARAGDLFAWFCLLWVALVWVVVRRRTDDYSRGDAGDCP